MVERPILFNGDMVRAILSGRKTQTRRVIRRTKCIGWLIEPGWSDEYVQHPGNHLIECCPYGSPGDRLWVRETWATVWPDIDREYALEECDLEYRADLPPGCTDYPGGWPAGEARGNPDAPKWKPSIHMPRWASRISLDVTGVRIERVQGISKRDAIAEGIRWSEAFPEGYVRPGLYHGFGSAQQAFQSLWDDINAKRGYSWQSNPWVWVIEFRARA